MMNWTGQSHTEHFITKNGIRKITENTPLAHDLSKVLVCRRPLYRPQSLIMAIRTSLNSRHINITDKNGGPITICYLEVLSTMKTKCLNLVYGNWTGRKFRYGESRPKTALSPVFIFKISLLNSPEVGLSVEITNPSTNSVAKKFWIRPNHLVTYFNALLI